MSGQEMVSSLGFGTLIIVLIIALVLYLNFMRKPRNRHPMDGERERNIGEIRDEAGASNAPGQPVDTENGRRF
jgi:cbb3-type cytochrome oxidase subunit 3